MVLERLVEFLQGFVGSTGYRVHEIVVDESMFYEVWDRAGDQACDYVWDGKYATVTGIQINVSTGPVKVRPPNPISVQLGWG